MGRRGAARRGVGVKLGPAIRCCTRGALIALMVDCILIEVLMSACLHCVATILCERMLITIKISA